jgi:hypothetical protein
MKRKEEKNKKTKERDQRAVEITREPLRFTHQKTVFFFFFSFSHLLVLPFNSRTRQKRGEKGLSSFSLSLSLLAHDYYVLRGLKLTSRP